MMKVTILCKEFLRGLTQASSCVESRLALPILSTALFRMESDKLSITATNTEVEVTSYVTVLEVEQFSPIAIPVRKLLDTCKNLPSDALLHFSIENSKVTLNAGRGQYLFTSLPAQDFPLMDDEAADLEFSIPQNQLKHLFDKTQFAVAQQDVRFFLNGLLWEIDGENFTTVGADGHRMACAKLKVPNLNAQKKRIIVPRTAILELSRLLDATESTIDVKISTGHVSIQSNDYVFRTKLIESTFPDHHFYFKTQPPHAFTANKEDLKQILTRSAIFTDDQYHHSVRMILNPKTIQVIAKNSSLGEANEELTVEYEGEALSFGFNVKYLLDGLSIILGETVKFSFTDSEKIVFIGAAQAEDNLYFVLPVRL